MKSFTSLKESRKLAEFLPLESADAIWVLANPDLPMIKAIAYKDCEKSKYYEILPAWSLAALLNILKYPSITKNVDNKWHITDWTGAYPKSKYGFDSSVDACYEMIIHLHEQKLL